MPGRNQCLSNIRGKQSIPPILQKCAFGSVTPNALNEDAPNDHRQPDVTTEERHVEFQADNEEEHNETDISDEGEVRARGCWEDVVRETWNMTADGGAEQDATDDLCNNLGLPDATEKESQGLREDDDDPELDNEQPNLHRRIERRS